MVHNLNQLVTKKSGRILLALLSGALLYSCIYFDGIYRLVWICISIVPLFFALQAQSRRFSLLLGFLFGFSNGLFMASSVISMASAYFESSIGVGYLMYFFLALLFTVWPALFSLLYATLKVSEKPLSVFRFLLVGAIWVSIDFINYSLLPSFPWTNNFLGYYIATLPEFIQIAQFTGVFGITFLLLLINYSIYLTISKRSFKLLVIPFAILLFQFGLGALLMLQTNDNHGKLKVSIVLDNLPTDLRWVENISDSTIEKHFLSPNREAVKYMPNLIVWTETAFPWRLSLEDDLLHEILKITYPTQAGHIIGIWTEVPGSNKAKYNSALYIQPDGRITDKYDKTFPLAIIESPLMKADDGEGGIIPFLNTSFNETAKGVRKNTLKTTFGTAGMIICNETSLAFHARNAVKEGAQFLTVMSNDAWASDFKNILQARFLLAILRAVETGRDAIVASNKGYTGFINANGTIKTMVISDYPESVSATISKRNNKTFYVKYGDAFSYMCMLIVVIGMAIPLFGKRSKKLSKN